MLCALRAALNLNGQRRAPDPLLPKTPKTATPTRPSSASDLGEVHLGEAVVARRGAAGPDGFYELLARQSLA
jgi:hypothetical protein